MEIKLVDIDDTFEKEIWFWRNDPETRNMSFNQDKISWEDHCIWFKRYLINQEKRCFIGKFNSNNIGILRFDKNMNFENSYSISIIISPKYRGIGFGKFFLDKGINKIWETENEIKNLFADVKKNNEKSFQLFRKLKFRIHSESNTKTIFVLNKKSFIENME